MLSNAANWLWGLLPLILGTIFLFWVYLLQERVDDLEKRLAELEDAID